MYSLEILNTYTTDTEYTTDFFYHDIFLEEYNLMYFNF